MDEVVLDGDNGRSLTLRRVSQRDREAGWTYQVILSVPAGTVTTDVYDYGDWLSSFFRDLAEAWKGFDAVKEYGSVEGEFHLACSHDGLGTVSCVVTLGQPWPPEWSMQATLDFGAGAHLDRLASDVEAFVAASG